MPNFFETMGRSTATLSENKAPEFLLTHPVSTDRMAETRARAKSYPRNEVIDSAGYSVARARAKLLTSSRPEVALEYFEEESTRPEKAGSLETEYGIALAQLEMGNFGDARDRFAVLLKNNEEVIPFHSGMAIAEVKQGDQAAASELLPFK